MSIVQIVNGDCLTVLKALPDACFDSVVTDPPAGIGFMGKAWDGDKGGRNQWIAWLSEVMGECLRVLKPGGHALVWALPRTSHWTATAVEDAGFEIRDVVMHIFGSGFPKSLDVSKQLDAMERGRWLDVSKAIDKAAGAERERLPRIRVDGKPTGHGGATFMSGSEVSTDTPNAITEAAKQWQGWGTALKPAAEHWILARKPLIGTVAANVTEYGTGAINVGGCRIAATGTEPNARASKTIEGKPFSRNAFGAETGDGEGWSGDKGRWPANVTLDEEAAEALDAQTAGTRAAKPSATGTAFKPTGLFPIDNPEPASYVDSGGASRFFLTVAADCSLCGNPKHSTMNATKERLLEVPCEPANFAAMNLNQTAPRNDSVLEVAPVSPQPMHEGKWESRITPVGTAVNHSAIMPQTIPSIALPPALLTQSEQIAPHVQSAGSLCDQCATAIAQSLVATLHGQDPVSHLGKAFMPERKKQILIRSLALYVASLGNTDTTTITQSLSRLFGFVHLATANITAEPITASCPTRFLYQSKPSTKERNAGLEHFPLHIPTHGKGNEKGGLSVSNAKIPKANTHPTVKPIALMRYLCRLITPPGGIVLDPFCGSGTTGCASVLEGFGFVGIEMDAEHVATAEARIAHWAATVQEEAA